MRTLASSLLFLMVILLVASPVFAAKVVNTSDIETAIMNKNYEQAHNLSSALLKGAATDQERLQAEYYLGVSQLRLKQYVKARSSFQVVMVAATDDDLYDRAALGMIESLYIPGFYKEALKASEKLLKKSPRSAFLSLIYLKIARIHLKMTQWGAAKEYLQKVIREYPQSFEAQTAANLLAEKEYFTVQVGSFLDSQKAIALAEELKATGQYAYIVETTTDEKKFYRVRVGQMASLSDAQSLETKLSELGYPTLIYP